MFFKKTLVKCGKWDVFSDIPGLVKIEKETTCLSNSENITTHSVKIEKETTRLVKNRKKKPRVYLVSYHSCEWDVGIWKWLWYATLAIVCYRALDDTEDMFDIIN